MRRRPEGSSYPQGEEENESESTVSEFLCRAFLCYFAEGVDVGNGVAAQAVGAVNAVRHLTRGVKALNR